MVGLRTLSFKGRNSVLSPDLWNQCIWVGSPGICILNLSQGDTALPGGLSPRAGLLVSSDSQGPGTLWVQISSCQAPWNSLPQRKALVMSRLPESSRDRRWLGKQPRGGTGSSDSTSWPQPQAEKPGAAGLINNLERAQATPLCILLRTHRRCFSLEELQRGPCLDPTARSLIWSVWGTPKHAASNVQAGWEPQDWREKKQREELEPLQNPARDPSPTLQGDFYPATSAHTEQHLGRFPRASCGPGLFTSPWPSHPLNHRTLVSIRLWRPIMKKRDFSWKPGKPQVTFHLLIHSRTCPSSTLCARHWHADSPGFQTGCEIVVVHIQHPV